MDTGMNRKVDGLGRLVLPAEIRRTFGIKEGDHLNIAVENDRIVLSTSDERCVFCGTESDVKEFRKRMVCTSCIHELSGGRPEPQAGSTEAPGTEADWDPFAQT